jgi:tetratricopeptide (TPR) repeat protein
MRLDRPICIYIGLILISTAFQPVFAQMGFNIDVKKPEPYDERVLKSEKTPTDKKIKAPKRFLQNLTTHYNYFFNASNKLNEVIDRAKEGYKDDYSLLLPFYNYTLDATAREKTQLDSVVYKAQTGIVMHDLRNDWVDNLYLLWGASYYFQKKFDSAALMFQFINYAFADKEKDGYYKYIGSHMDGNNALSVSTKENRSFPKNMVTPPSRNVAFIWQIRTLIESDNLSEAGSLIATLKNDPLFPKRLQDDLEEVQAYWYYKQNVWDSSATHLVNALDQAKTKHEKGRWEFLAAQMFERSGKLSEAEKYYTRSIGHTTDPVMDVYARLNLVRINKEGGENYIDKNIAQLLKMAKRDKYEDYRDVIYFMAAQMEMERNNMAAAQDLLLKGAKYNNGNLSSKNNAYLLIADLSFDQKKYFQALSFYDSIQTKDLAKASDIIRVNDRKASLAKIVFNSGVVNRQDSLQRIAALPEEERATVLTRLLKQLRRQQGLQDDNTPTSGNAGLPNNAPVDLFQNQQSKGEWYFYNTALKTQGLVQFKQIWGNRPNVDNWRRFADVNQQLLAQQPNKTRNPEKANDLNLIADNSPSFNSLLKSLPITEAQLSASNDSIRAALFNLGIIYLNEVEDYPAAIDAFEKIRTRFPDYSKMDEVLFNLYYTYTKSGDAAKAAQIKNLLSSKYPQSRFTSIVNTGKDPLAKTAGSAESTKDYEAVYDLFLAGKFDEAEAAKKIADSAHQTNYWQPQLLYIEAVYQIRQRQDSVARNTLLTLIAQDPNAPLSKKAQNLLQVLNRRAQIEDELTKLEIQRPVEDTLTQQTVVQAPPVQLPQKPTVAKDSLITKPKNNPVVNAVPKQPVDTTVRKPIVQQKAALAYKFDPADKHFAVIILDKVDGMFVNEAKNAFFRYNREKYYTQTLNVTITNLDDDRKLLLIGDFTNAQDAIDYAQKAKRLAPNEIVPWLKADKYSISILSNSNLPLLLEKKDLVQYKQFLEQNLPGKF